jgi:D5 N terminal like
MLPTPFALSIPQAVLMSGVSRSMLYEAIKSGELTLTKINSRSLILHEDLVAFLRAKRDASVTARHSEDDHQLNGGDDGGDLNASRASMNAEKIGKVAQRFHRLFLGLEKAYGRYVVKPGTKADGKGKIDGVAKSTVHEPVTDDLWQQHLEGADDRGPGFGIGVVPIREDSTCSWGAIDVDVYPLDLGKLEAKVRAAGLPLTVCRTKSGGAHLYLFVKEPVPAALVRGKLVAWAASLGYAGVEVFPKQTEVGKDDTGNWINMPYQAALTPGGTNRFALAPDGAPLSAEAFLSLAAQRSIDRLQLEGFASADAGIADSIDDDWTGAPPCLVTLAQRGWNDWDNDGFFNVAVYLRKRHGDEFGAHLDERNRKFFGGRVDAKQVVATEKSVRKKSYAYKCKQEPICSACDKAVCKTREFGVGGRRDDGARDDDFSENWLRDRMLEKHGDDLRYSGGQWYAFDDGWRSDINQKLPVHMASIVNREASIGCADRRQRISLNSHRAANAVANLVSAHPSVYVPPEEWDARTYVLGMADSVWDLTKNKDEAKRPYGRDDYISMRTSVSPDWNCPTPLFTRSLEHLTCGDGDQKRYVQTLLGLILTGDTSEQKFFIWDGRSGIGKGTVMGALAKAMGDYAMEANPQTFVDAKYEQHPTHLASLRGKRFVTISELKPGQRLNEVLINTVTGGGRVRARFMGQDEIEFDPQFYLNIATNHLPALSTVGVWRRLVDMQSSWAWTGTSPGTSCPACWPSRSTASRSTSRTAWCFRIRGGRRRMSTS